MRIFLLVTLFLLIPLTVLGEDSCRAILENGFFEEFTQNRKQSQDRAMLAQFCGSNFQQAKSLAARGNQSGGGMSIGGSYAGYGLEFGSSSSSGSTNTEEKFNEWKNQHCSNNTSSESLKASEFLMQKTVAESVVNAWSECMQVQEGLSCWASPFSDEILFSVNWKKVSLSQPIIESSFLSPGAAAHFDNVTTGHIFPSKYNLNPGTIQIPIIRPQGKKIVASLNAKHDGVAHTCGVFVPGENDFKVTQRILFDRVTESEVLGCKTPANGGVCHGTWAYTAPSSYKVCTVDLQYTSGPTEGAEMALWEPNESGGTLRWKVDPNPVPFGSGRWVRGKVKVTFVPVDRSTRDDGRACAPKELTKR